MKCNNKNHKTLIIDGMTISFYALHMDTTVHFSMNLVACRIRRDFACTDGHKQAENNQIY